MHIVFYLQYEDKLHLQGSSGDGVHSVYYQINFHILSITLFTVIISYLILGINFLIIKKTWD